MGRGGGGRCRSNPSDQQSDLFINLGGNGRGSMENPSGSL